MDVISHGLWGGITVGRSSRKSFWIAFLFGVAPDVFAFGPRFVVNLVTQGSEFFRNLGRRPELSEIPDHVFQLYNISHSLVVFAVVFGAVWLLRGKPMWEMCAWPLHILVDIFTHSLAFFQRRFSGRYPTCGSTAIRGQIRSSGFRMLHSWLWCTRSTFGNEERQGKAVLFLMLF